MTVLIIGGIIVILLSIILWQIDKKTRELRKNLKVGDRCYFYHQWEKREPEERSHCEIVKIKNNIITVKARGNEFKTTRKNLYV